MHEQTIKKDLCCWITCPAHGICDLYNWRKDMPEREESEKMLKDMLVDIESGHGPFSPKDRSFLQDMLDRLSQSENYVPSFKQSAYVQGLHSRWIECRR